MTVHGVKQSASTAAAGADHNFATHLDSVVPQRAPTLIHMLVDRPSTPGVDNPDTDPSCTGQNFATHLDSPAAQGADAVIHTVSPMSFHSGCGQAGSWNMRPLPVGATSVATVGLGLLCSMDDTDEEKHAPRESALIQTAATPVAFRSRLTSLLQGRAARPQIRE